ncbi:MAG: four helix bundle protein [Gemmatimonadaceae bacterium]
MTLVQEWFTRSATAGRLFRVADFRKLRLWQDGHALAAEVERVLKGMQKASTRDLCDQLSRASRSVPANIAEGSAHESPHQFARYLQYALGSTSELEEHVQMARHQRHHPRGFRRFVEADNV